MRQSDFVISVIVPVLNREKLIIETLNSVAAQTLRNWECIIVDDGSKDCTLEIVQEYLLNDHRFKAVRRDREPQGASTCRNIGMSYASSDYILFLDSDDLLVKECLEKRLDVIRENPGFDFWVFRTGMFKERIGDLTSTWNILNKEKDDLLRFFMMDNPWQTSGQVWMKSTLESLGGFDESALSAQEWELNIRAILHGFSYYKHNDDYIDNYYRHNPNVESIGSRFMETDSLKAKIDLYDRIFQKVGIHNDPVSVTRAFAVRYFHLLNNLYYKGDKILLRQLLKSVSGRKIFSSFEILLMILVVNNLDRKLFKEFFYEILSRCIVRRRSDWFIPENLRTFHR
jgi:glycosyltransferase involved in cell wall biosynthesis